MGNTSASESNIDENQQFAVDYEEQQHEGTEQDLDSFLKERGITFRFETAKSRESEDMSVRLVFAGDTSVGKTSILNRLLNNTYVKDLDSTIGVTERSITERVQDLSIMYKMYDLSGQERYRGLQTTFMKNSAAILLVYDITDSRTFDSIVNTWLTIVREYADPDSLIMLVGAKSDLDYLREVYEEDAREFANQNDLLFMEISSKVGTNVDKLLPTFSDILQFRIAEAFEVFKYSCDRINTFSILHQTSTYTESSSEATVSESVAKQSLREFSFLVMLRTKKSRKLITAKLGFPQDSKCATIQFTSMKAFSTPTLVTVDRICVSRINRMVYLERNDEIEYAFMVIDQAPFALELILSHFSTMAVKMKEKQNISVISNDMIKTFKCQSSSRSQAEHQNIQIRMKELERTATLDLSKCISKTAISKTLLECIRWTHLICKLDLSCNNLRDQFIQHLVDLLLCNRSIYELILDQNMLTKVSAQHIVRLMNSGSSLDTLSLAHNKIGDDGAIKLLQNCSSPADNMRNPREFSINLAGNSLHESVLVVACSEISRFRKIDLSDNLISEGVDCFDVLVAAGAYLGRINLDRNMIMESDSIRRIMQKRPHIISAIVKDDENYSHLRSRYISREELEMVKIIGRGKQGTAFQANWRGNKVAVKAIFTSESPQDVMKEIDMIASVNHPNCLEFKAVTVPSEDVIYFVSELMDRSLQDMLYDEDLFLHAKKKMGFAQQIARGLNYLHEKKPFILHRDIKPDNIFVDSSLTTMKVGDYGFSEVTGTMLVTAEYLAPELIQRAESYSSACDVYAFAIVLWQIWFKQARPYTYVQKETGTMPLLTLIQNGLRPSLDFEIEESMRPVHTRMVELIQQCWSSKPEDRPMFNIIFARLEDMLSDLCKGEDDDNDDDE